MPQSRWDRLRRFILERDSWRCTKCGRPGRLEVHHADHDPSNNDVGNLTALCRTCHIAEHARKLTPQEQAWRELLKPCQ